MAGAVAAAPVLVRNVADREAERPLAGIVVRDDDVSSLTSATASLTVSEGSGLSERRSAIGSRGDGDVAVLEEEEQQQQQEQQQEGEEEEEDNDESTGSDRSSSSETG
jgi:hypothetical protein